MRRYPRLRADSDVWDRSVPPAPGALPCRQSVPRICASVAGSWCAPRWLRRSSPPDAPPAHNQWPRHLRRRPPARSSC
ncbi:hypothetical protein HMPREF0731_0135 [Pseudoroseomonas cervicalis ATCC 49957]|uniref:Uncharacterized protein n=1 Tax=Pseudoroseomonas cervicalis ATCC 49957 TaxID=525371 RepID=D5RGC6_9PROT|nr:hypothetical protein HMPREF0731_0135 [Pseudoroseomonas cervicalis ATCC 49957]